MVAVIYLFGKQKVRILFKILIDDKFAFGKFIKQGQICITLMCFNCPA